MFRRLSVQTSGESHGRVMLARLAGLPAGHRLDLRAVDAMLRRRQGGYGRSARQRLEQDAVEVLSGLYKGRTSGAPLTLAVWNRDDSLAAKPPVTRPRPGHADLAGGAKFDTGDMRPVLERASARETAARVAAGAVAAQLLARWDIEVFGHVVALGGVAAAGPRSWSDWGALARRRDRSAFFQLDPDQEAPWKRAVDAARKAGDTLGGVVEVRVRGLPAGLGSQDEFASRLDARVGAALLSIQAMKAVEIGDGVAAAAERGSAVHDALRSPGPGGPRRASNRAGGLEGGLTNGEDLVARAHMKPLSTLVSALPSWDYATDRAGKAHVERSDVTAVPAASVVAEAMLALVALDALLESMGGDAVPAVSAALARHRRALARRFGRDPKPKKAP